MRTLTIITIAILTGHFSFAQESGKVVETLKGKVINASTSEPVSYTNIGLEGTFYGTASDSEGNFELKIPAELANKNIYFSAIGFENKMLPVKTLFNKEFNVIRIESKSYGIGYVSIMAQSKVLIRILTLASENIPYNYILGPYNLLAGYNNQKIIDDTISMAQKAEVLIYDQTGYSNPSKSDAYRNLKYLVKNGSADEDYRFSGAATNIDDLLEFDWVRSASSVMNSAILNAYQLELDSEPIINGKEYWVISFSQKNPTPAGSGDFNATKFEGKITVDKNDYSVLKITGKVESPKSNRQGKSLAIGKTNSNYLQNVSYNFDVVYEKQKLKAITMNKGYNFEGKKVVENSTLKIAKVQATNLTVLDTRDYFPWQ